MKHTENRTKLLVTAYLPPSLYQRSSAPLESFCQPNSDTRLQKKTPIFLLRCPCPQAAAPHVLAFCALQRCLRCWAEGPPLGCGQRGGSSHSCTPAWSHTGWKHPLSLLLLQSSPSATKLHTWY